MEINPYKSPQSVASEPIPGLPNGPRRFRWSVIPEYLLGLVGAFEIAMACLFGGALIVRTIFHLVVDREIPNEVAEFIPAFALAFTTLFTSGVSFALSSWYIKYAKPKRAWIAFFVGGAIISLLVIVVSMYSRNRQ